MPSEHAPQRRYIRSDNYTDRRKSSKGVKQNLDMSYLDNYYAFKFIKLLTDPWEQTDAYQLGIVDQNGKQLKKRRELRTQEEKRSFTRFHKLVFSIKTMLEKVPFARSTLARYATALAMIKEETGLIFDKELLSLVEHELTEDVSDLHEQLLAMLLEFNGVSGMDISDGGLPLNKRDEERTAKYKRWLKQLSQRTGVDFMEDTGDDIFAGNAIFDCDPETFQNCRLGKKKYARYSKYVGSTDQGERIRQYGIKNPKKAIVLRDNTTGAMRYLRRK